MSRTPEHLRKEAKTWLKRLRDKDPAAVARLAAAWPDAPPEPTLRDVQYALAREYGSGSWAQLIAAAAAEAAAPGEEPIHALLKAADAGDAAAVESILDRHPGIIDERGTLEGHTGLRTALHFGVHHEAVVRALLARGADPNIRDEGDNAYPLHFAAERGDLVVVRLLIEHGAETVAGDVDDHGLDIIGWATCFAGVQREVAEYLLAHGARHTLHSAVAVGDTGAIRARATEEPAALERPMDKSNRRRRALHLAVVKRQPASLRTLLELGADPNGLDAGGLTPLDEAALAGQPEMATMLVEAGAKWTLPAAVAFGRDEVLRELLAEDPGALKPGGRWGTLIVKAASHASGPLIERLIELGAEVNVLETPETSIDEVQSFTPLHAAAFHGNLDAVEVLLRHGANPRVRDSRYASTPAGWANYAGQQKVLHRLLEADLDIFDAIEFDRPERIREILRSDPAALNRTFGACLPADAKPQFSPDATLTPLEWATARDRPTAIKILTNRGGELTTGGHLSRSPDQRAAAFLRMVCIPGTIGGQDRQRQTAAAARMLRGDPGLATHDFYTAVACGAADEVARQLAETPGLANTAGGPRRWAPLLYLCTARLPQHPPAAEQALTIAELLLDHGADPNVSYSGGDESIRYSALTSVIGRGEEQAPTHPRARELARLLLDRGAEPYDVQVFYNAFAGHASHPHLADDDLVWLLDLVHQASLKRGRAADWADPDWPMLGMGGYGGGAWYLLYNALQGNYLSIARWALAHGARPDPPRARDPRIPEGSLYEQAVRLGLTEFADLLAQHGAPRTGGLRADETDEDRLVKGAQFGRYEIVRRLLDRGVSPNAADQNQARALHHAAYAGRLEVVRLLVEHGADVDPRDGTYGTTPIFWAAFGQRRAVVDFLAGLSRDVWTLVPAGKLERLKVVLAEEPQRARTVWEGWTPLFELPEDEALAAEIVRLFLTLGADPDSTRPDGATATMIARARGLTAAADLLSGKLRP